MRRNLTKIELEINRYLKMIKRRERPISVSEKVLPKVNQLRMLAISPPIYLALVGEGDFYAEKFYEAIPLVEEITLGVFPPLKNPLIFLKREELFLACLPMKAIFSEETLLEYSYYLGEADFSYLEEFVERAFKIPAKTPWGKFLKIIKKRLFPFNFGEIIDFMEKLEKEEEKAENEYVIVEMDSALKESLIEEYSFSLTASGKKVFRGKNYLAYVETAEEEAKVFIYLPENYKNKQVKISIEGKILFEGQIGRKPLVILKNFPLLSDYTFLEEKLDVRLLQN
ncbi:MAG: hypothetical protein ACPLWD_07410 [Caldimicrobium thiodismutans]